MQTFLYRTAENSALAIQKASELLRGGGLVAIPTETVYGLAANALDEAAVRRIFEVKGRPADNPLIVHISDIAMWAPLVRAIPDAARALAQRFWPGPLSIILPQSGIVPAVTRGGLDTVAVRMPAHDTARAIIKAAGVPIAAPSANLSGSPSPTTAQHCIDDLWGRVGAIVDGGACGVGLESTVISLAGEIPTVLRPGAVTLAQLREVLGEVALHPAIGGELPETEPPLSPGMKYRHYSPNAQVVLLDAPAEGYARYANENAEAHAFALCFEEDIPLLRCPYLSYGQRLDHAAQARLLFTRLRELDRLGARVIHAHCPSRDGVGAAVYDRILRAAGGRVTAL